MRRFTYSCIVTTRRNVTNQGDAKRAQKEFTRDRMVHQILHCYDKQKRDKLGDAKRAQKEFTRDRMVHQILHCYDKQKRDKLGRRQKGPKRVYAEIRWFANSCIVHQARPL
jgi:uncharacterized protein (UPF0297 family)